MSIPREDEIPEDVPPTWVAEQNAVDNEDLLRHGRKPRLERFLGFYSVTSLVILVSIGWEAVLLFLTPETGDQCSLEPSYEYVATWIGSAATALTVAELISMVPTAGGQHHWVYILAPQKFKAVLSYTTGWLTALGWQAGNAAILFTVTHIIQALLIMAKPGYRLLHWQIGLVYFLLTAFSTLFNGWSGAFVSPGKGLTKVLEYCLYFAFLFAPLCCYPQAIDNVGDKVLLVSALAWSVESIPTPAKMVIFAAVNAVRSYLSSCGTAPAGIARGVKYLMDFSQEGTVSLQGVTHLVKVLGPVSLLLGLDAPAYLTEETLEPGHSSSNAVVAGSLIKILVAAVPFAANWLGLTKGDFPSPLPLSEQLISLSNHALKIPGGVTLLAFITALLCAFLTFGSGLIATRTYWALARDKADSKSESRSEVDWTYSAPRYAAIRVNTISATLGVITFGIYQYFGTVELFSVLAVLLAGGLFTSYTVSVGLLLYRRATRQIHVRDASKDSLLNTTGAKKLTWGVWRVPEPMGTLVNLVSFAYLLSVLYNGFFPVMLATMTPNYSSLLVGASTVTILAVYLVWHGKEYKGPVVEVKRS